MKKEFIPYNEALELEELGFDEPCFATHGYLDLYIDADAGHIKAPTYRQAFRWFREKHNLFSSEVYDRGLNTGKIPIIHSYSFRIINLNNFQDFYGDIFENYEEAELSCLRKLIELVKS